MAGRFEEAFARGHGAPPGDPGRKALRAIGRQPGASTFARRGACLVIARGACLVIALVACHPADAPAPAAPKGPTACARAADSMVGAMLARLPNTGSPPTQEADAIRNSIRERCERDGWSAEAIRCLIAMKRFEDAEPCAKLLTEDQQAALVGDLEARFGAADRTGPAAGSDAPPAK